MPFAIRCACALSALLFGTFSLIACASSDDTAALRYRGDLIHGRSTLPAPTGPEPMEETIRFHCDPKTNCPELSFQGAPIDHPCLTINGAPVFEICPVRGNYDGSITEDPETGTLWLSYSFGSMIFNGEPSPKTVQARHDIRLARSDDGGITWIDTGRINEGVSFNHPSKGQDMISHEVSTIDRLPDGRWALLWFQYFKQYEDAAIRARIAEDPLRLGDAAPRTVLNGWAAPEVWATDTDMDALVPGHRECAAYTEPAIFAHQGETYVIAQCIGWDARRNKRIFEVGRLELLRWDGSAFDYIGPLMTYDDTLALSDGTARNVMVSQPALARSRREGRLLLLVSLGNDNKIPNFQSCHVLAVDDLAKARLKRDAEGRPVVLAELTTDVPPGYKNVFGPGQCDYDPASETGVLMTRMVENHTIDPMDLRIAIHATGVHP